jgi:crotonobetainyl-CoA:carnitine CoA-transferase CaiB-like acyl-CoA transferase
MTAPLEGIRVVEMTSVVLGPYACQMLGDLGADVIKIEPPGGDTNRNLGPHRNNSDMGSMYLACNRNKRSVSLDL